MDWVRCSGAFAWAVFSENSPVDARPVRERGNSTPVTHLKDKGSPDMPLCGGRKSGRYDLPRGRYVETSAVSGHEKARHVRDARPGQVVVRGSRLW